VVVRVAAVVGLLQTIACPGPTAEILNFANLPVVAFFTALDLLVVGVGGSTSNQVLVARQAVPA
jgi:hypothetical protein